MATNHSLTTDCRSSCFIETFREKPTRGVAGLILAALVSATPPAGAEIAFDRGSLTLTSELTSEYDSNIFSNRAESADWHNALAVGGKVVRDAGLLRFDAKSGVQFQSFQDNTSENSVDPFVQANAKLIETEDGKFDGAINAFFRRRSDSNVDVNTRARVQESAAHASFKHFPFEKGGYRVKADFFDQNFLTQSLSDVRTKSIDGEGLYHFSPKADLFVGVGGRWSETYHVAPGQPRAGGDDIKLKAGLDGEILPKVTGRVAAGYVHRRLRAGGTQSGALFDTSLQWRPDNETSVTFTVNRDLDTSPNESVVRLIAGIEAWRQVREKIRLMAGVSHVSSKYLGTVPSRRDDTYVGTAGLAYSLTSQVTARFNLSYADTGSDWTMADYSRLVGGLTVAVGF